MRTLSVIWLHTRSDSDGENLPIVEYGLSDAFREFCAEAFNVRMPLEYPPLRLTTISDPADLARTLFVEGNVHRGLTECGCDACLFLIDDTFYTATVDGIPLKDWFKCYIPALPKILVTYPGHTACSVPQRRWSKKPSFVFESPVLYHDRLVHLFKSFWMPRFWSVLKQYVQVKAGTNWHTPGHNSGQGFAGSPFLRGYYEAFGSMIFRSDLSVSVESLGDLSSPEAHTPLSEAQKLTSEIFGTALSCYVTNGTSTANKAMLMTLLKPGETVFVDRNCHKSVHHAIVMAGAIPHYLPSHWNARLGIWGPVALETIAQAFETAKTLPKLLVLTTCSYEGVLYPVWEVAQLCERHGVVFYADEAWAAYLAFHPFYSAIDSRNGAIHRYSAVNERCGAHFAVQSTHKTMPAFSQASMIHVSTRFKELLEEDSSPQFRWLRRRFALHGHGSYEKFVHDLREFLRYWHSTSPHYPFLATLDLAGVQMRLEGMKLLDDRLKWVQAFRKRVAKACGQPENVCFADLSTLAEEGDWQAKGYFKDPLKIVIVLKSREACMQFKKALRKAHIQWEKATAVTVLFLVTMGTQEENFEDLFRVCRLNADLIGLPAPVENPAPNVDSAVTVQPEVLPHDAALCDGELVLLENTVGRIASQFLVPYPPGIPVFIPGLRITAEMVDLVRHVIETEGVQAVHGLFCRGEHAPYYVEVLNRDEEKRLIERFRQA